MCKCLLCFLKSSSTICKPYNWEIFMVNQALRMRVGWGHSASSLLSLVIRSAASSNGSSLNPTFVSTWHLSLSFPLLSLWPWFLSGLPSVSMCVCVLESQMTAFLLPVVCILCSPFDWEIKSSPSGLVHGSFKRQKSRPSTGPTVLHTKSIAGDWLCLHHLLSLFGCSPSFHLLQLPWHIRFLTWHQWP